MLTFYFTGAEGKMTVPEVLTAGMVGKKVTLAFAPEWENLSKTVIFSDGVNTRDVVFSGNPLIIPAQVLENPLRILTVGVYGLGEGGKLVIPTVRVRGPLIQPGANPSGDPAVEPENPLWQQVLAQMGDLSDLKTFYRSTLVDAINELEARKNIGLYTPGVSAEGMLSWSNNVGAPNPAPVSIRGPQGKTAYQYAVDGGFGGTEEEFAELMANSVKAVQPDWNQNDPDAPDYVMNRTHWEEGDQTVIAWNGDMENRDIVTVAGLPLVKVSGNVPGPSDLVGGSMTWVSPDGAVASFPITEESLVIEDGYFGASADLPVFVFQQLDVSISGRSYSLPSTGIYMVSVGGAEAGVTQILTYGSTTVHKIDEKFIPDTIARVGDIAKVMTSPEPAQVDIPKVFFGSSLPQTKDDTIMSFRYLSQTADISGYCKTRAQGNSSMRYPKKNQTVELYADAACTEKLEVDFRGWGKQHKFCFKANWIDLTHARNVVSARLWGDVVKSRENYEEIPGLLRTSPNQGAVDGFPVKVYADGIYQGRYTLNIPKNAWMANMDKELDSNCILCGENYESGCFRSEAKIDESDWTDEVHDKVPVSIKTRWNQAINFVMTSSDEGFRAGLGRFFDVPSLIDYYLFGLASCGLDAFGKNQLYMTYDGQRWYATMYDMDSTWGLYWDGSRLLPVTYGRSDFEDMLSGRPGNLLYLRLESLFHEELVDRWEKLKAGALSVENIVNRFERFMDIVPRSLVEEDYAQTTANGAFTGIPLKDTNHIQQIRAFARARRDWMDCYLGHTVLYQLPGEVRFDGTDCIDTGVQLFDTDKPFTLCLDWTHTGESDFTGNTHVIAHAIHEVSPWPGLIVHYNSGGIGAEVNQSEHVAVESGDFLIRESMKSLRIVVRKDEAGVITVAQAFSDGRVFRETKAVSYVPVSENLLLGCYQDADGTRARFAKGILSDCIVFGKALSDKEVDDYLSGYAGSGVPVRPFVNGRVSTEKGTAEITGGNHVSVSKETDGGVLLDMSTITRNTDISGGGVWQVIPDAPVCSVPAGATISIAVKNFGKHGLSANSEIKFMLLDMSGTEYVIYQGTANGGIGDKTQFGGAVTLENAAEVGAFVLSISWNDNVYTVEFDAELYINGRRYV